LLGDPSDGRDQETSTALGLLLAGEHIDGAQAAGAVDRDVHRLVSGALGGTMPAITADPMADRLEAGQLFCIAMYHVAAALPLLALPREIGVEVAQSLPSPRALDPPMPKRRLSGTARIEMTTKSDGPDAAASAGPAGSDA